MHDDATDVDVDRAVDGVVVGVEVVDVYAAVDDCVVNYVAVADPVCVVVLHMLCWWLCRVCVCVW